MLARVLVLVAVAAALLPQMALAYDNGLGLKPALGWNTWCTLSDCHNGDNQYFDRCNEWEFKSIANAMLENGMFELGYDHLNADDCWAAMERDANGNIQPDPDRFPSGMKALADWLHARGFKFGLYTSMGSTTCNRGGRPKDIPGSFGHYEEDAKTFASWEMDYVKVDWCGGDLTDPEKQHTEFSNALNATGRPIWLELCRGYSYDPIPDYVAKVAQSWRLTGDHQDEWSNTKTVLQAMMNPSNPGVPHAWNYGDFLMTGGPGCNVNATLHCPRSSEDEYRTSFAVWSISASPLIVSTDIRNLTTIMKQTLLNREAIMVNQDYKSPAGKLVGFSKGGSCGDDKCPVYARALSDGTYAAVLLNMDDHDTNAVTLEFKDLGVNSTTTLSARDILFVKNLGSFTEKYTTTLRPHQSVFLRLVQA